MVKKMRISSYIRKPFLIEDFAPDPIWISLYVYEENWDLLFISAAGLMQKQFEYGCFLLSLYSLLIGFDSKSFLC